MRRDNTMPAPLRDQFQAGLSKARISFRIIKALILREIMTRFGREHMGFIWLVLEPMILTSLIMIAWYFMFGSTKHGIPIVQFALTGYSGLTLWRHVIFRLLNCYKHNAPLFFHRNVRPMDTIFARFFLETIGTLVSFFASFTLLYLAGWIDPIANVSLAVAGWFVIAFYAFSVALVMSALAEMSEITEKFMNPMMYVTLPLTGVFTLVAWLPQDLQAGVLYSPIIHGMEMFRAGVVGEQIPTHWDTQYVLFSTVITAAIGFTLMQIAENRIKIE